jgi:predicted phage tail protein
MTLRRVHLHGSLKKHHDGPIEVNADTVGEAIRLVSLQLPGFRPNARTGYQRVQVAGCNTIEDLFVENDQVDIHLFPQFCGGKRGGFLQILLGTALVVASFIVPPAGILAGILLKVGALVILGGVLQLFSAPQRDSGSAAAAQQRNHYLGPPQNTVGIGTRIPILYGRRKVGGHLLSVNVNAV